MGHSNHWAELLELNGEVRRVEPTDVTLLVHFWYFLCSKTWYDGHRKMDWLPIKIFLPIYYNRWSVKWVNLIISDYWLWNLSRKHSPKQSSLQSRLVRENSCTCILLVWNFLICKYYITGIWPWRLRWLSRWWTREIFWNHTRRVQKWTNCKSNTIMTLLYIMHYFYDSNY